MKPKLLCIGDHFILPGLMRSKLGPLQDQFTIAEASTPFPLEPFRNIAEVQEASGSEEQMIEAINGVSVCIAHHAPLTRRILSHAPALKLFIVCRGGPVNVNLEAATEHNVIVCYAPGRNAAATAEYAIAMILNALRGIPAADAAIRAGQWKGDYTYATAGFELAAATVGLIGYGAIGRLVARMLCGFGARVLAYDPVAKLDPTDGVEQVSLDQLLERSNVISLHAREDRDRKPILGKEEFARMRQGSVVVNCARGSLMDYEALADALECGKVLAAAADVFPVEPVPAGSRLLSLPNFVMTPHIAGGTRQAAEKAATIAAQELERYWKGQTLRHCANPEAAAMVRSARAGNCS